MRDNYAVPVHVTATGVVSAVPATLQGLNVNTIAAAQTITIYNDPAAANLPIAVLQLDTRDSYQWGSDGAYFSKGIYVVISGGAPDLTFIVG